MGTQEDMFLRQRTQQRANFYIIRKMWVTIHGKRRGGPKLHEAMMMSRPRYERFIHGLNTRISGKELQFWESIGIPKKVITGEHLIEIFSQSTADWDKFFSLWEDFRDEENSEEKKKKRELYYKSKRNVDDMIVKSKLDDTSHAERYQVSQFIHNVNPPASSVEIKLLTYTNHLNSLTVKELLHTNEVVMTRYIEALSKQLEIAKAVETLKKHID